MSTLITTINNINTSSIYEQSIDVETKGFDYSCKNAVCNIIYMILAYEDKPKLKYIHLAFLSGFYNSQQILNSIIMLYENIAKPNNNKCQRGSLKYLNNFKHDMMQIIEKFKTLHVIFEKIRDVFLYLKMRNKFILYMHKLMRRFNICEEIIQTEEYHFNKVYDILLNINNHNNIRDIMDTHIIRISNGVERLDKFRRFMNE